MRLKRRPTKSNSVCTMHDKIRLPRASVDAIIKSFKNNFAVADSLWIFGSRVDLSARGGDIDLYIETDNSNSSEMLNHKLNMISEIWQLIGEQRIDVVLHITTDKLDLPIYRDARNNGVKIV